MSTPAPTPPLPWLRLRRNRMALLGLGLLALIALACVVGPWFSPHGRDAGDLAIGPTPPSAQHWFGTDLHGRDVFTRTLHGGRVSLLVGLCATLVSVGIGVAYGMVAAFKGGLWDRAMMRLVEILSALPFTLFVILLMVMFGRALWLIFLAIGLVQWLDMARIIRAHVLDLKSRAFVEAARALGQSAWGILWRHLLPNSLGMVIVCATLTVPTVILLESFVSFLGLGVQPPMTSWGDLIREGAESFEEHPWLLAGPALFFLATLLALNFCGDGLRDAFDPRSGKG